MVHLNPIKRHSTATPHHKAPRLKHIKRFSQAHNQPAPFDSESASADDELVEGLLGGELGRLPCGKLDEGALLSLHNCDGTDLAKLVEVIPAGGPLKGMSDLQHRDNEH